MCNKHRDFICHCQSILQKGRGKLEAQSHVKELIKSICRAQTSSSLFLARLQFYSTKLFKSTDGSEECKAATNLQPQTSISHPQTSIYHPKHVFLASQCDCWINVFPFYYLVLLKLFIIVYQVCRHRESFLHCSLWGLHGRVDSQGWLLWGAGSFIHVQQSRCQVAPRWMCCWSKMCLSEKVCKYHPCDIWGKKNIAQM